MEIRHDRESTKPPLYPHGSLFFLSGLRARRICRIAPSAFPEACSGEEMTHAGDGLCLFYEKGKYLVQSDRAGLDYLKPADMPDTPLRFVCGGRVYACRVVATVAEANEIMAERSPERGWSVLFEGVLTVPGPVVVVLAWFDDPGEKV